MTIPTAALAKAAAAVLSDEQARKKLGWGLAAIFSPIILTVAFFCSLLSGSVDHNYSVVNLCFAGGEIPAETPAEYTDHIEEMRQSFALLDNIMGEINEMTVDENGLDENKVKAVFYALYFGESAPGGRAHRQFVDCFISYEERTRTIENEDGTETEEIYTVAIPITDIAAVYRNLETALQMTVTEEQEANADSVYSLVRYGAATGSNGWVPGADTAFIGTDGFCSPIGAHWENYVSSEFGIRTDPFTKKQKGHSGMDLAVPTGTPVRAALGGTVTAATYNVGGYGYYVVIDHGDALSTLYGHCFRLLVRVGQTVEAGDIVALSGNTGRSTGPHLHFEVRISGERTNPRAYLPASET